MSDLANTMRLEQTSLPVEASGLDMTQTAGDEHSAEFYKVFETMAFAKRNLEKEDQCHVVDAVVGNPTAGCHSDGACADDEKSKRDGRTMGEEIEPQLSNSENGENKHNNNGMLETYSFSFNKEGDRRVYANFEDAGLPRRELKRLAQVLQNSAIAGRRSVSFGISLPEIGEIRFDVRIEKKVVFIHAFVQSERASAALALAISALRDELEKHDLLLGQLDVTTEDGRGKKKPSESGRFSEQKSKNSNGLDEPKTVRATPKNDHGLIHVLA